MSENTRITYTVKENSYPFENLHLFRKTAKIYEIKQQANNLYDNFNDFNRKIKNINNSLTPTKNVFLLVKE